MPKFESIPSYPYTEHYKEECFKEWYSAGRPSRPTKILEVISPDETGRKPKVPLITAWRDELLWDVRADELDARANAITDDELVNQRVLMLKEHAARGRELQVKGMEYLRETGFDTSSSAVSAIFKGSELERTSRGISERLIGLLKLPDDRLTEEVQKLLDEAADSGEIIDVGEADVEDAEDS